MKIWYEVSDEGVYLGITRLIAPDDWTPEPDTRIYATWADARHYAIERQRWVLREGEYDPAKYIDPAIESLWPERNDGSKGETREHIESLLNDLEDTPYDDRGFAVFEESRLRRLAGRIDNLPRTEVVAPASKSVPAANTGVSAGGSRGTAAAPRAGDSWDESACSRLRDELVGVMDGYRGRCVAGGSDVTLVFVVPAEGRRTNEVKIDLVGLQERVPALRFEGTVAPPPFASRQGAVNWCEKIVNVLIESG